VVPDGEHPVSITSLPKPRTFDDVAHQLRLIEQRIDLVYVAQRELGEQMGRMMAAVTALQQQTALRPPPPMRDPESSYHDWDEDWRKAKKILAARERDPNDKMDSDRVRGIAKELVEFAKNADDAAQLRTWRTRVWAVALPVVVGIILAALGFAWGRLGK
jgi:hypothetical protein